MRFSKKPGMNSRKEDGLSLLGWLLKSIPHSLVLENGKDHTHSEVPVSIIRNNLKTAGITREEYFVLLEKD